MSAKKTLRRQIVDRLALPLAQVLVKCYFGEPATTVAGGLGKIITLFVDDLFLQNQTERSFKALADEMIRRVLPLFETAQLSESGIISVATQLGVTLKKTSSIKVFMAADLECHKVWRNISRKAPLPKGHFSTTEKELYHRALRESVTYLIQVCDGLPHFAQEHAAESLNRLSLILAGIDSVLDAVHRLEKLVQSSDRSTQFEASYRLAAIRTFDYIELFGATFAQESRHHVLSVGYVSLTLHDGLQSRTLGVDKLLTNQGTDGSLSIVRGPAGSGKSTLLRWIAIRAAANARVKAHYKDEIRSALKRINATLLEDGHEGNRAIVESTLQELMNQPVGTAITSLYKEVIADAVSEGTASSADLKLWDTDLKCELTDDCSSLHSKGLAWNERVPFLVLLRHHRDGRLPPIESLGFEVCQSVGQPPKEWTKQVFKDGRALLLIDGIDEIPPKARDVVARSIRNMLKEYPNCQTVITTRPEAVGESWLASFKPRLADINPMSTPQREVFIRRWHEAVCFELELQSRPIDGLDKVAGDLHSRLVALPRLASLATNPLLCAMICAINRDRNQALPETQADLCEVLCNSLLQRDALSGLEKSSELGGCDSLYWSLSPRQRLAITQEFAYHMVKNDLPALDREEALEVAQSLSRSFRIDATALLQGLVERSGVLRAKGLDALDFIHNSIKEFLASRQFATNNDYGLLANRALDATWQNVLMFAVAVGQDGFAVKLVRQLILQHAMATDPNTRRRLALLIARARSEALYFDDAKLETKCTIILRDILPPESVTEAGQLAELGQEVVPFLGFDPSAEGKTQAACIRTLRLIGGQAATDGLRAYEASDSSVAKSELAQAMNPIEVASYRNTLLKGDALPAEVASQVTSLAPLEKYTNRNITRLNLDSMNIEDLSPLQHFPRLRWLFLSGLNVTDISPLASLKNLEFLYLADTQVENLEPLRDLGKLRWLDVEDTQVADITPLSALTCLEWLDLRGTHVSNLRALFSLSLLSRVNLVGLSVGRSALSRLKKALPLLDIRA